MYTIQYKVIHFDYYILVKSWYSVDWCIFNCPVTLPKTTSFNQSKNMFTNQGFSGLVQTGIRAVRWLELGEGPSGVPDLQAWCNRYGINMLPFSYTESHSEGRTYTTDLSSVR